MKHLLVIIIFIYSGNVAAISEQTLSIFIKNEFNGDDSISGLGVELLLKKKANNFGFAINSTIGAAEVTDTDGFLQNYIAWEVGMKLGYFSKLSLYGEVGFDLAETIFQDRENDNEFHGHQIDNGYDNQNDIDGYIGIGAGMNFGNVQINAYSRLRQIDGKNWKAKKQNFTGIILAFSF